MECIHLIRSPGLCFYEYVERIYRPACNLQKANTEHSLKFLVIEASQQLMKIGRNQQSANQSQASDKAPELLL